MKKLNAPKPPATPQRNETDIVQVLAKLKGQVVRERIRVIDFLIDYDKNNENCIPRENFIRGLGSCRLTLTPAEMDTLADVFASPMRRQFIDYKLVLNNMF